MAVIALLHKRKKLFFIVLCVAFSAFMVDIADLREELQIISSPYSSLDNNVTTGITTTYSFKLEPALILYSVQCESSAKISFLHLLTYGFRAPPFQS
jgi:hypothetical protein